jgi:glycosyltransferase involved in cell wall biosynthesis
MQRTGGHATGERTGQLGSASDDTERICAVASVEQYRGAPVISVTIPVLNGGPDLIGQLRALEGLWSSEPWEVVIADNGSTNGSFQAAREFGDDTALCWRLQLRGFRFAELPDAMGATRARTTFRGVFRQCSACGWVAPILYQRHQAEGLQRDLAGVLNVWASLVLTALLPLQSTRPFEWARGTGIRIGRLEGSWRHRVVIP